MEAKTHYWITRFLLLAIVLQFASGGRVFHIHVDGSGDDHVHASLSGCSDERESDHTHAHSHGSCTHSHAGESECESDSDSDSSDSDELVESHHHHCLSHCMRSLPGEFSSTARELQIITIEWQLPSVNAAPLGERVCELELLPDRLSRPPPRALEFAATGRDTLAQCSRLLL